MLVSIKQQNHTAPLSRKRCGSETADGPVTAGQTMFCDPGQPISFLCLRRGVLYHMFQPTSPTGMLHKYHPTLSAWAFLLILLPNHSEAISSGCSWMYLIIMAAANERRGIFFEAFKRIFSSSFLTSAGTQMA